MKIREIMTTDTFLAHPDQTVQELAHLMLDMDIGALPVGENDRLSGMLTDRDIAVRVVALGKGPQTTAREAMTEDVKYCYEDEDGEDVARNMSEQQVKRLPVLNRDKRLVGIVSLADVAATSRPLAVAEALAGITQPGGAHTQSEPA